MKTFDKMLTSRPELSNIINELKEKKKKCLDLISRKNNKKILLNESKETMDFNWKDVGKKIEILEKIQNEFDDQLLSKKTPPPPPPSGLLPSLLTPPLAPPPKEFRGQKGKIQDLIMKLKEQNDNYDQLTNRIQDETRVFHQ